MDSMIKKGFTLLEVLISLLILTAAVTIYSSTQLRSILRVSKEKEFLDRVFIVRTELIDFIEKQKEKEQKFLKKEIENPEMKISSEIIDINKKSKLKPFLDDLKIVKTEASWSNFGNSYNLPFITFIKIEEKEAG